MWAMKPKLCSDERTIQEINHVATGAQFRRERIRLGISLRSLARAAGQTAPYLSDLELGRRNWTQEKLASLSKILSDLKA
jgi:transcriptional regulator with XRE-family HTH domain